MARIEYAFLLLVALVAQVLKSEGAAPLPGCISGLSPLDRLPQDLGTVCAGELDLVIESKGLIGTIPESIGDLSSLTLLNLISNSFTGGMPSSIGKLQNLTNFKIVDDVGGRIPDELWSLDRLTVVGIRSSGVSGSIPTTTLGLAALEVLELTGSSFSGDLPTELGQLPALRFLEVSGNSFTGDIGELQDMLCAIDARTSASILPGNSFTGIVTDQCMYTQGIVPSTSFTASPTSSPVSPAASMYGSMRDFASAVVLVLCMTLWQV